MTNLIFSSRVDSWFRVELPLELCERLFLQPGDKVRLRYTTKGAILTKAKPCCSLCGSESRLRPFGQWFLCERCVSWVISTELKSEKKSRPE